MEPHDLKRTTLQHVARDFAFHCCRGDCIDNIWDMANCVESLSDYEFRQHVAEDGSYNHIADWVRSALDNADLAEHLNWDANLQDKAHFVKTIRDHVAWLESI